MNHTTHHESRQHRDNILMAAATAAIAEQDVQLTFAHDAETEALEYGLAIFEGFRRCNGTMFPEVEEMQ